MCKSTKIDKLWRMEKKMEDQNEYFFHEITTQSEKH